MTRRLHVVIVNYRTAPLAVDCLRSIESCAYPLDALQVHVVDNDSRDHSVPHITQQIEENCWGSWARLLPAKRNGGFAYGNNIGIRTALQSQGMQYLLLLNPDTLVRAGAIDALISFMDAHPQAGIAGSALESAYGDPECAAHNAPSPLGELEGSARLDLLSRMLRRYVVSPRVVDVLQPCDWVSGASLMIRRKVLETVGLMDESFFLYFEEVDYCVRARKAGWKVWYVPQSRVVHLEGASTGIQQTTRRRPSYWYASRRRFFLKHYGVAGFLAADALWAIGHASLRVRRMLGLGKGGRSGDPPGMVADLLWGDLKALLRGDCASPGSDRPPQA
jgi:GT2 family glycosyltransferase